MGGRAGLPAGKLVSLRPNHTPHWAAALRSLSPFPGSGWSLFSTSGRFSLSFLGLLPPAGALEGAPSVPPIHLPFLALTLGQAGNPQSPGAWTGACPPQLPFSIAGSWAWAPSLWRAAGRVSAAPSGTLCVPAARGTCRRRCWASTCRACGSCGSPRSTCAVRGEPCVCRTHGDTQAPWRGWPGRGVAEGRVHGASGPCWTTVWAEWKTSWRRWHGTGSPRPCSSVSGR